jgi:hypothetical protein
VSEKCKYCKENIFDSDGQSYGTDLIDGTWICFDDGCMADAIAELDKLNADMRKANAEAAKLNADLQEGLAVQTERLRTARKALSWIASNDPKGKGDAYYHSEQSGAKARSALEHLGA